MRWTRRVLGRTLGLGIAVATLVGVAGAQVAGAQVARAQDGAAQDAGAQDAAARAFPDRPVRLLVGFAAGGPSDVLARIVARRLERLWKQPVIVENRTGAAGTIAAAAVARAPKDGLMIAFAGSTTFVGYEILNPAVVPYRTLTAFEPVTLVADQAMVMAVRENLGPKTLQEFVALAKARPGALNFGMSGLGSPPHLNMELLKQATRIEIVTVPFNGSAPANQALLSGTVDAVMDGPQGAGVTAETGRARLVAVASERRLAALPDVPTFAEAGYDAAVKSWYALLVPKGTPEAIVRKIDRDTRAVLAGDEVRDEIARAGFERNLLDQPSFAAMLKAEYERIGRLIETAGIKVQQP